MYKQENYSSKRAEAVGERNFNMKKLQHPHIIQLMEVYDTPETLYLVLEFAGGGELFDAIVARGFYAERDAAHLTKQVLEAICYVHSMGIAHRDLKPENLLLANESGQPEFMKIADFGLSKDFGSEGVLKTQLGTPDYVAPEVILGEEYGVEVDIWSIGVIIYILLCGYPPFDGETQKDLFDAILSAKFAMDTTEWDNVSSEAKKFVQKLLVAEPKDRYTAEQALKDPWILKYQSTPTSSTSYSSFSKHETFNVEKFREYTKKYKEAAHK